jgi:hypothetical protein
MGVVAFSCVYDIFRARERKLKKIDIFFPKWASRFEGYWG